MLPARISRPSGPARIRQGTTMRGTGEWRATGRALLLALAFFIPLASNAGEEVSGRRSSLRTPVAAVIAAAPED